jgi:hypothetical protein
MMISIRKKPPALLSMDHHENPDTGLILCGAILVYLLYQVMPFPQAKLTLKNSCGLRDILSL